MKQGTENGAAPNEAAGNQERIEEARQLAYDHGLPFSSRPSQGAEDDLDPYTYDASMTPEDFELMQQRRQAHQELKSVVAMYDPDMAPKKIDEIASVAAELHLDRQQLWRLLSMFDTIAAAAKQLAEKLLELLQLIAEWAAKSLPRQLMEAAMHAYAPPKWWHYYKHAKKSRVRKKYEHRIRDSMLAALAALREEGEGCRECITPAPSVAPI
ncbi:hypothetical protein B5F10_19665 [Anaerotruncus colihominis]|uniref:Uncharacterized protein n=1 Tax=Anaerotruncus colihominis TaxID=169435 RepID=A0A1Y4MC71_9FIRM|nr:hypothetical protein [Anaerotruncus colihominis]OUP65589.1 hypothetical protein B5F11_19710 [Anaerotruncus colihominis]OUP69708.1 hypothetical protein B5F10_19665 [Anaerotruncus colihominis]